MPPTRAMLSARLAVPPLLLFALAALLLSPTRGTDVFANSDYVMNHRSNTILTQIYEMSPSVFDPNAYISALVSFYGSKSEAVTQDYMQLVEWCGWPNSSLIMGDSVRTAYCYKGIDTSSLISSKYVLVSYKLYTNNDTLFDLDMDLAPPLHRPAQTKPRRTGNDPAVFDADTVSTIDEDTGLVTSVLNDSVAFWAIFGCLVGVFVVVVILLGVLRCYRDRKQRERNTDVVRGAMHEYHRERTSFFQTFLEGMGKKSKHSKKKSRRYGVEDPNDIRSKYDIAGAAVESSGSGSTANATAAARGGSAVPTSRASAYWPSAENHDVGNDEDEREMEERESSRRYY